MANVATLGAKATFDASDFVAGVKRMKDGVAASKDAVKDYSSKLDALADKIRTQTTTAVEKLQNDITMLRHAHVMGKVTTEEYTRGVDHLNSQLKKLNQTAAASKSDALWERYKLGQKHANGFSSVLESLRSRFSQAGQAAQQSSIGIAGMTAAMTAGNLIASAFQKTLSAISGGVKWGADLFMQAEKAEMGFSVMLKSGKKAQEMMENIEDFAIKTPFDSGGLTKNVVLLKGMGVATDDLLPAMKTLGDLSLGDNEKLQGLALAYGQVMAKGRLMGQEFNQLAERGINLRESLAKNLKIEVKDVAKAMEEGKISAAIFRNSLIDLAESDFGGMMEKMGETAGGKIDKIKEKFGLMMKDIAGGLLGGSDSKSILDNFANALDAFRKDTLPDIISMFNDVKSIILAIGGEVRAMYGLRKGQTATVSGMSKINEERFKGRNIGNNAMANVNASFWGLTKSYLGLDNLVANQQQRDSEARLQNMMKNRERMLKGAKLNAAGNVIEEVKKLEGLKKIEPPKTIATDVAKFFAKSIGDGLKSLSLGNRIRGYLARGMNIAQDVGESAQSFLGGIKTKQPQEYKPTGALVAGSSEAFSAQIKNMFAGEKKSTIEEKQLNELKKMAAHLAKLARDGLTSGFKGVGTVESFLAGEGR